MGATHSPVPRKCAWPHSPVPRKCAWPFPRFRRVGRGFAIWGPFRVQASVKAPESCAWSTRSEGGRNLLGRNLDGNQIARKYRTCAGHADLLFRDGGKRQAGKCDCLPEFTSRPELALRAAQSGHNSMCQNGLEVLLRVTVRTKKQRPDTGLKAPPALGGSAMVARPTRRQIFAVN